MSKAPPAPPQQRHTPSVARHLAQQKQAEALPDLERRKELGHDLSLACLVKSVCPGCGRPTDLKNEQIDFCPHCGISLFHRCGQCSARKSAIARYCTLLPCLWNRGEWGSRLAWLIMPALLCAPLDTALPGNDQGTDPCCRASPGQIVDLGMDGAEARFPQAIASKGSVRSLDVGTAVDEGLTVASSTTSSRRFWSC